jgi:hypothetical protein
MSDRTGCAESEAISRWDMTVFLNIAQPVYHVLLSIVKDVTQPDH